MYPLNRVNKNAAGSMMIWVLVFVVIFVAVMFGVYEYEKKSNK
jgi:cbb3-type cytochrome oxidase subunit 3